MHPILVLMWKHFNQRKMKPFMSTIEIFAPGFILFVAFITKDIIMQLIVETYLTYDDEKRQEHTKFKTTYLRTHGDPSQWAPTLVMFTPNSELANYLFDEVGKKLLLEKHNMPTTSLDGYFGFPRTLLQNITNLAMNIANTSAVVILEDMEGTTWPSRLNYTIRMKLDSVSRVLKPLDTSIVHRRYKTGAISEPFIHLQWAIDTSYLQLVTGRSMNMTVQLQQKYVSPKKYPFLIIVTMDFICSVANMFPIVCFVSRLVDERVSGMQETLRLSGAPYNEIMTSHVCNTIFSGLVYIFAGMCHLKSRKNPLAPNTNFIFFLIFFDLHFSSLIAFASAISYLPRSNQYSVSITIVILIVVMLLCGQLRKMGTHKYLSFLTGLLPNVPMEWFWEEIFALEIFGEGLTIENMFNVHFESTVPVFLAYTMLIIQSIMYVYIGDYLRNVIPGKHGVVKPWCFCLKKTNRKSEEAAMLDDDDIEKPEVDPQYFEEPSAKSEVCIRVQNVTKLYGRNRVLNNVSFDVYRGEITVLLGHNGAGKTTLMSIITGIITTTSGQVYINGRNVVKDQGPQQNKVGFCPQHNCYFSDFTVKDHVQFFSMLRGKSEKEAKIGSESLLEHLQLQKKANVKGSVLTGGMLRRLQMAMAMAGDPDVLILDEPTAGLDVKTRNKLWNELLSFRGHRTVVLSTHSMQEASALGDRVVAIHSGTVRCHASPIFLKKSVAGYRLTLQTEGRPKRDEITSLVKSVIPDISFTRTTHNSVSYSLPCNSSSRFSTLFSILEQRKEDLKIVNIRVGVPTFKEVFLKLCSDGATLCEDEEHGELSTVKSTSSLTLWTGLALYGARYK